MEVILRQDVPTLGKAGQLVKVKPGYARNCLLPQGLAVEATAANKQRIAAEAKAKSAKQAADKAEALRLAAALNELKLTIKHKAGDEGRLFGSVTTEAIADALKAAGFEIDRKKIDHEHPLRHVGFHTVPVRLHADVHAELKVNIVAE